MEVSVPLAALSERTNIYRLATGAERHLGSGFGSMDKMHIYEKGVALSVFRSNGMVKILKYEKEIGLEIKIGLHLHVHLP